MIIVPPPQRRTSARSRDLAARIRATIADFERANPKATRDEVASALHEVQGDVTPSVHARRRVRVALAACCALLLGAGGAFVGNANEHGSPIAWPLVAMAGAGAVVIVVLLIRLRDQ